MWYTTICLLVVICVFYFAIWYFSWYYSDKQICERVLALRFCLIRHWKITLSLGVIKAIVCKVKKRGCETDVP